MTMVDLSTGTGTDALAAELGQWGLGSLADAAAAQWARDPDQGRFAQWLRGTQQYKDRFPYMDTLAKEGRAITEAEALSYERNARQIMRAAGLPAGTFDTPAYVNKLILSDVSINELEQRVQSGLAQSMQAPPEVRAVFAQKLGAAGDGALAAFYLDPDHTMADINRLEEQANVVGRGQRLGLNIDINAVPDFASGFTPDQIQQQLEQAAQFAPLGRGVLGTPGLTDTTLAKDVFTGNQGAINKQLEQRAAEFSDTAPSTGGAGQTGFGSARGA